MQRRRFTQTDQLEDRLAEEAKRLREDALVLLKKAASVGGLGNAASSASYSTKPA